MTTYDWWLKCISERYKFFANTPRQKRADDYPWEALGKNRFSPLETLKYAPVIFNLYQRFFSRHSALTEFLHNGKDLWSTRCLFDDEVSRSQFDEAILIRMLGHGRYFSAPEFCQSLLAIEEVRPLNIEGIPEKANGIPIEEIVATLNENMSSLRIYSTRTFASDMNHYRQYFLKRKDVQVMPEDGDVVFDCGSCLGDTTILFAAAVGSLGQVHSFDPIPFHNRIQKKQIELNPGLGSRIKLNCVGVSNYSKIIDEFAIDDSDAVSPGGIGNRRVSMTTIDDYVEKTGLDRVNLLKMDIEGFEISAIEGACNTIKKHRPKLAICVYHRTSDFWEIPNLIKSIENRYKFAFAHHSPLLWESMIYCSPLD